MMHLELSVNNFSIILCASWKTLTPGILAKLEAIIDQRYQDRPANSYVTKLFEEGGRRIAQKVGEEGVELALAGVAGSKDDIKNESADLLFHLLVLLKECRIDLLEVLQVLSRRAGQDQLPWNTQEKSNEYSQ